MFKRICKLNIAIEACLVGLLSGLFVVMFKVSIDKIFYFTKALGIFLPLATAIGGLISGYLVYKIAPEAKASGIPYVKATLLHLGNLTRVRSIFVKFFGGIASIGTGMSLGREGPSVQLGAGVGALISRIFKNSGIEKDKLIASGAGAALAATFNAPISGTIFVLEELMQKFTPNILFISLVATYMASSFARFCLGDHTTFFMPYIEKATEINIFHCLIIGLISGFTGVLFSKLIHFNNNLFFKMKLTPYHKTMITGFVVGIIGLYLPLILGSGNISVNMLLHNKIAISVILLTFLFKFIITPICFASGAVGGIFLPMLMIGAYEGYLVGALFGYLGFETNLVVMALIGMATFFSSVARTPITASIMVFEMTGEYNVILPIMLSAAVSDFIAERLNHKPIYSELIVNQVEDTEEANILKNKTASEIMTQKIEKLDENIDLSEALKEINSKGHEFYPVVDKTNMLKGAIYKSNIQDILVNFNNKKLYLKNYLTDNFVVATKDMDLYTLYFRLHINDCEKAIVIDNHKKVIGIISRNDIQNII